MGSIQIERVKFWNQKHVAVCQGQTWFPEERMVQLCSGKSVLEIGPGDGRQLQKLIGGAKDYSIADICPAVVKKYVNLKYAYEIMSMDDLIIDDTDQIAKFDVVHCWYVIHHILKWELARFFAFVCRHLARNGVFVFNYPVTGDTGVDPRLTIHHSTIDIVRKLDKCEMDVIRLCYYEPRNVVIEARQRGFR